MAVFHPHSVRCICGNELMALLADSINIKRAPALRDKILREELHRAHCPGCNRTMTVERPLFYTDMGHRVLFKVLPRWERHFWRDEAAKLEKASSSIPTFMANPDELTLRVVFGMDELREKLVAQDAGLDDRLVELLKVILIYEHPILIQRTRLRLVLGQVTDESLEFRASYEHHPQRFLLRISRDLVDGILDRQSDLESWVTKGMRHETFFESGATWVNLWRLSPQPPALRQLREYAAQIAGGKEIDPKSRDFKRMLNDLPRGKHMPRRAKRDMAVLWGYARKNNLEELKNHLFEVRYGLDLEDDWAKNEKRDDIDTIWRVLEELPDTHIEGNTELEEIRLEEGEGGGWYDAGPNAIGIGSDDLDDEEEFEYLIRHEVGHAVHEQKLKLIDDWLDSRFGWRTFDPQKNADIDAWVELMGGWGDLTPAQRRDVRGYLRKALGKEPSWDPGPTPTVPRGHPWRRKDFGPRLAFERTGSFWYDRFDKWYRANGKAFFLNFYYKTLLVVDEKALDLAEKMPDPYACMSHFEYFAEVYALYYGANHPLRKKLPKDVVEWLEKHLGLPEAVAKRPARGNVSRRGLGLEAMVAFRRR